MTMRPRDERVYELGRAQLSTEQQLVRTRRSLLGTRLALALLAVLFGVQLLMVVDHRNTRIDELQAEVQDARHGAGREVGVLMRCRTEKEEYTCRLVLP